MSRGTFWIAFVSEEKKVLLKISDLEWKALHFPRNVPGESIESTINVFRELYRRKLFLEKLSFFNQNISDIKWKSFELLAKIFWHGCQNCISRVQRIILKTFVTKKIFRSFLFRILSENILAFHRKTFSGKTKTTICVSSGLFE